ncbi:MAG: hypothetical protein F9K40_15805 [Kofleriaceae bacterium]|nr:MAG: hypothetical protein F9K40_15805 [Kofleriaceae bacterium]MBZ0236085.1 hypothetical protein [Kofleriaceae bacterium]
MPAGSDDETALTHAPPAGIAVVRRTAHLDGGPFRDAEVAEDLQLTFPGADDPSGSPFSPAVAVVSVPIIVTALIAGAFELASVLTGISFLALHEWTLRRRPRSSRLVIASSAIISQDQTSVPLGRIRRTSAIPTSEAHEVRIDTTDGVVVVARVRRADHARYLAARIEDAYRAFLRGSQR